MFERIAGRKSAPAAQSSAAPQPAWRRQLGNIIETQIARYPFLLQLRAIWRQLQDERESWPLLIPFLLVLFVGFYRAERARIKRQIEDLKAE